MSTSLVPFISPYSFFYYALSYPHVQSPKKYLYRRAVWRNQSSTSALALTTQPQSTAAATTVSPLKPPPSPPTPNSSHAITDTERIVNLAHDPPPRAQLHLPNVYSRLRPVVRKHRRSHQPRQGTSNYTTPHHTKHSPANPPCRGIPVRPSSRSPTFAMPFSARRSAQTQRSPSCSTA